MTRYLVMLLALVAVPASAQTMRAKNSAQCAQPAPLPPELAAWGNPVKADAARNREGLAAANIVIGKTVRAVLPSTPDIHYLAQPEKPGSPASHGGLFSFTVKEPGTYRVALGSGAWIDVLKGDAAVASTAHSHGPACSDIRKMVDFPLDAGPYILQLAASDNATLTLLIARVQ